MSGREMVAGPLTAIGFVLANAGAWWESFSLGTVISSGTLILGLYVLAMGKITKSRNELFLESERTKMQAQKEWEATNAGSLSRQIEEFREQAAEDARKATEAVTAAREQATRDAAEGARRLIEAVEDNKRIRKSLHELRNQANLVALQHADETGRLKKELEVTNGELHEMRRLYTDLLRSVNTVGRKVDVASASVDAVGRKMEVASDNVQVLADQARASSGELPAVPRLDAEPDTDVPLEPVD